MEQGLFPYSSTEMEKSLYDAALNNDVPTLIHLLKQDPNLLERTYFQCQDKNPLHIAVMQGNLEFVQEIVKHKGSFYMCLGRDRDGRNPLHLAAMYRKLGVLEVLIQAALPAATEKADGGGTILHLCVKYNQLEALKFLAPRLKDPHFQNAKNEDGMTILHLAINYDQMEEERLSEAELRNDTVTLSQLPQQDSTRLDRANLNFEDKNARQEAANVGNMAFVQAILLANSSSTCYQMCLARDGDGRNPVHLAAMYGQLKILNLLLENHDGRLIEAALEKTDREGTILHLCVKRNQLKALKLLIQIFSDPEFVGAKNDDGMTILHLAIFYNQNQSGRREMVTYLIEKFREEMVNIKNTNGKTAMDLVLEQGKIRPSAFQKIKWERRLLNRMLKQSNAIDRQILHSLAEAGALTGQEALSSQERHSKREKRSDALIVVAALIATMAFQAMVSPPGGFWQEDLLEGPNPHRAGGAVLEKTHPKYFRNLITANTLAFVFSFSAILVLIRDFMDITSRRWDTMVLSLMIWLSMDAIGITYATSFAMVDPESERDRLIGTIGILVIVNMLLGAYTTWSSYARKRGKRTLPSFST